jgi:hypothetical protein
VQQHHGRALPGLEVVQPKAGFAKPQAAADYDFFLVRDSRSTVSGVSKTRP